MLPSEEAKATQLCSTAFAGDVEAVFRLLKDGVSVNVRSMVRTRGVCVFVPTWIVQLLTRVRRHRCVCVVGWP